MGSVRGLSCALLCQTVGQCGQWSHYTDITAKHINITGEAPDPVCYRSALQGNMGLCGPDSEEGGPEGPVQR